MRSGTTSYTGLDSCGAPRVEAGAVNLSDPRTVEGFDDLAEAKVRPGDGEQTLAVRGVLR